MISLRAIKNGMHLFCRGSMDAHVAQRVEQIRIRVKNTFGHSYTDIMFLLEELSKRNEECVRLRGIVAKSIPQCPHCGIDTTQQCQRTPCTLAQDLAASNDNVVQQLVAAHKQTQHELALLQMRLDALDV